jgi:orotidine-5'-phosphate decarboxylase
MYTEKDQVDRCLLSSKKISDKERLIVALDVNSSIEALSLVERIGESVAFYKIGLQLLMGGGYFELIDELVRLNKKVFVDLKFYDVPETVGSAVRQLTKHRATFVTVHGYGDILRAAVAQKNDIQVLAVTVLTSFDQKDIRALGFPADLAELVNLRAKNAIETGCDGVIASGLEAQILRKTFGDNFLIVTPGIRPRDYGSQDDQKRTVDPEQAFKNGADYIVVGRPILKAPDPRSKAEEIQRVIAGVFSDRAG